MNDLKNKNIIVTGATGGIGHSIIKKLHGQEVNILASGTRVEKLEELKKSPVGKATGIVTTKEGIGAIGGGAIGAALGGSLGVAGKIVGIGVALNGGIVLAGVGALVGFLGVKAFKKNKFIEV